MKPRPPKSSKKVEEIVSPSPTLINIDNSTFFGIILKGAVNNWFSVLLVTGLLIFSTNLYIKNKMLEDESLKADIKRLNSIVESNEVINKELKLKIKQLQDQKGSNKKAVADYRKNLKKMDSKTLHSKIQEHVKRLKRLQNIKD